MHKREQGQGLTEYIIIVALIAIATISIVKIFGETIRVNFAKMTSTLQDKKYRGKYQKVNARKHVRRSGFKDMDQ